MDNKNLQITNHDFLIYRDSNNDVKVSVMLINNDIWLTQNLIAELFGVGRSTITEHINNILNSGELDENNTVGKTDLDNSKKTVKIYNLDMIIAVGYRVIQKKQPTLEFGLLNYTLQFVSRLKIKSPLNKAFNIFTISKKRV